MAVLKQNAGWFGLSGLLLGLFVSLWWVFAPTATPPVNAAAPPAKAAAAALWLEGYSPLDTVTAARIERLRRDCGWDDDALAVLNLDGAQLEALLASLRSWYESNATSVAGRWTGIADQQALIRHYESRIGQGHDESSHLTQARQQLAQLQSAYETLLATPRQTAATAANLSEGQRAQADALRNRRTMAMPFRILSLNTDQTIALDQVRTRYGQRLATTQSGEERVAARAAYETELASAIGNNNVSNLHNLSSYLGSASVRVVAAVQLVLPVQQ